MLVVGRGGGSARAAARLGFGKTILADPSKPPGTDPLGYFSIFDAGNALAKNKSQSNQTNSTVPQDNSNGPGTENPDGGWWSSDCSCYVYN